jgi:hypothetical protein
VDTSGLTGGAPGACGSPPIAVDRTNVLSADEVDSASSVSADAESVAAGATIFVAIKWQLDGPATVTSVSGGGLTWTVDNQGGDSPGVALARAHTSSGLARGTTITATFSTTVRKRVLSGASFTGVDALDSVAATASGAGTSYVSGSVAASGPNELIVTAVEMFTSAGAWAPTPPTLSAGDTNAPASSDDVAVDYRIASSANSYSTSGSWRGAGDRWIAVSASYKPAATACR